MQHTQGRFGGENSSSITRAAYARSHARSDRADDTQHASSVYRKRQKGKDFVRLFNPVEAFTFTASTIYCGKSHSLAPRGETRSFT